MRYEKWKEVKFTLFLEKLTSEIINKKHLFNEAI